MTGRMNTAGWMNCVNEVNDPSQAALQRASQDVYDVIDDVVDADRSLH